jgi:glycosyltransferase involved in cell wall biosynthesis
VYDALVGKRLIAQACRLHALNTMEQKQFLEVGGRLEQIFIAPNCINVDEYRTLPQSNDFRAKHNIAPDAPLVLFLARINKIKGVDFLVSAFAEALNELPEAVLVIAGPDDGFLSQVKEQIQTLGIGERVRFIGYTDGAAKLEAYQAADVYVLPSTYEILGITLLEALACRTPVITTEQCGLADEIQQNGLGSVVEYGDVSGLKDELVRTLCNRETMRRDAERRREYVLANFDWDKIAARWEEMYGECAGRT